jgi:DNA-binding FadR family transcriptional regulator
VSLAQHERIVAAITARDAAEARAAMEEHITGVIDALRSLPPGHADRPPAPTEGAAG